MFRAIFSSANRNNGADDDLQIANNSRVTRKHQNTFAQLNATTNTAEHIYRLKPKIQTRIKCEKCNACQSVEFGYFIIYEYTLIAVRQVDSCGNINTLYSTYAVHIRQGLSQCRGGGGDANIYRRCRDRALSLLAWSHGCFFGLCTQNACVSSAFRWDLYDCDAWAA